MPDGSMASMSSATLEVTGVGSITFPYNPQEWSFSKEAHWESTPQASAAEGGVPQFQGTKAQELNIKILLDRFGEVPLDPDQAIDTLVKATQPTSDSTSQNDAKPPTVSLQWGSQMIMESAFIKKLTITKKDLTPSTGQLNLAEADITMEAIPTQVAGQNPTSGALASRRTHMVIEGDTLQSIAWKEFRSANKWRALAVANGIDDPMRLKPGSVLIVPEIGEVDDLA